MVRIWVCKDLGHHPIDSQPFIDGCVGFQVRLFVPSFGGKNCGKLVVLGAFWDGEFT